MFDSPSHKISLKGQSSLSLHSAVLSFGFILRLVFLVPQNGCHLGLQASLLPYSEEEKTGFLLLSLQNQEKHSQKPLFFFTGQNQRSHDHFLDNLSKIG